MSWLFLIFAWYSFQTANESLRRISKAIESPKKKSIAGKRSSVGKSAPPVKKGILNKLQYFDGMNSFIKNMFVVFAMQINCLLTFA